MDQLQAIRVFCRVVEVGSFTKAADSLDIPNATLSKLVQSLEAHLQVKLLQRTTRRVSVTPEGADYYDKTMRLLKELDDADSAFRAVQSRPRGHLRVDIGSSLANLIIVPALPEFFERYPDIRIDLGVSDRQVDLIGASVDCVIRGGVLTDLGLSSREIGAASWVTCAAPSYLSKYGTPHHPEELARNHLIASYLSASNHREVPLSFSRNGERMLVTGKRIMGANESNAHLAAGLAGLGVIQTFAYSAREHIDAGTLIPILSEWRPDPYVFHVAYPPNRYVSQRLRVFIDWIAQRFTDLTR